MNNKDLTKQITNLLKVPNVKSSKVPKPLIAQAKNRKGLSKTESVSKILAQLADKGHEIGPFEDGTPNMMADLIEIVIGVVYKALQEDAKITVSIDPGVKLQATGANVGGPVQSQGQTTEYASGGAIIQ